MSYQKAIDSILSLRIDNLKEAEMQIINTNSIEIINALKLDHKSICIKQVDNISKSRAKSLFDKILNTNIPQLNSLLREILQVLYLKESPLMKIVYLTFPLILRKFIQNQDSKSTDLEQITKVIYFNESGNFNRFLKEREDLHKSPLVRDLYSIHFNKVTSQAQSQPNILQKSFEIQESQVSSSDKRTIKSIMLSLIYRNLHLMNDQSLQQYLKMIYFYCGGQAKSYGNITSFYLLQKKNLFNLFKYSISDQQIQWILLTLYQLSILSSKYKFQLLAAINMIYKKTANESMFKYSEIAQSIIHLLEDEYLDIFS